MGGRGSSHGIVSRFSVPRPGAGTATRHADRSWLDERLALLREYFAPSVGRLGVRTVLLCSSASASYVADRLADLPWLEVVVQDDWRGGWSDSGRTVTRLDSDDALHEGWFEALERAPAGFEAYCTKTWLRLDARNGRLHRYRHRRPSPLAAFRPGLNPFGCDHAAIEDRHRAWTVPGAYLLQVVHGGNLSSRRPRWWRLDRWTDRAALGAFLPERARRRAPTAPA